MLTIEQICAELPALHTHMLELTTPSVKAIRYTHAHTTKPACESVQERFIRERDQLKSEVRDLAEIAFILNEDVDVSWPIGTIAATIKAHAVALAAWPDLLQDLERIHHRWKTLTAPDAEQSNHLCPSCGTANLHYRHTDHLYVCPACEYAGTPEHVHNATMWRIKTSDLWITRAQACALFGLSRAALRKKIERGTVLVDMAGRVQVGSL
ncbi:hypothetical protein INS90_09730 [Trueperella pecoris]|uniref:Uncharacterized protein n=1 Tax=Trueperella pecoris TaxID=2733571 RepID=A0A7M1QZK8_9ACTO|nr:hypothetical protein [Trueperella pecoris]QOR47512.1 hypothetical protein INS90_09730 [Trueperella pecoris]